MQSSFTRRKFTRFALGAGAGLAGARVFTAHDRINSTFSGVTIGAQSYSFRDRPLDEAIAAMKQIGIGSCELWSGHTEPLRELRRDREKLRAFRLETPLSHYEEIGESFHEAGIELNLVQLQLPRPLHRQGDRPRLRDGQGHGRQGAHPRPARSAWPGASMPTPSGTACKWAMHNHSRIRENEYATPDDFAAASKGNSHIVVNLDIGHFIAAGFDPIDYIKQHHAQIVTLHIKDRKRDQGENVQFGEGDTPIRETLALLRDNGYDIPANIEYEYKGGDTVEEVEKCFNYCKRALAS